MVWEKIRHPKEGFGSARGWRGKREEKLLDLAVLVGWQEGKRVEPRQHLLPGEPERAGG